MKVTDVRIKKSETEGAVKATASITLDDCFAVHGVRVIDSGKGAFVTMPSRKAEDGKFVDICHPTNNDVRNAIKEAVLDKYNAL